MSLLTKHIQPTSILQDSVRKNEQAVEAVRAPMPVYPWKNYERILFRITFIFFIIMSIPNSARWYIHALSIDWTRLHYRDLYDIGRFESGINFFGHSLLGNTMQGYATWIITLMLAIAGGLAWTFMVYKDPGERKEYNILYYWLRVVVRYRAGIGIITFGFTKLLPTQMPYPSLGLLNTHFGDFTAQKIYWLSVGIAPWYQVFAGGVEILAGILLFFRRTTTIGAILIVAALGTIVFINFAYDGNVHVYSSYFVLLAIFLLVKDAPYIYRLLIQEKFTIPVHNYPAFRTKWKQYTRVGLKAFTLFLFLGVLFYLQLVNFLYDPYKQPSVTGVKTLRGNYQVTEFRINNNLIPYSPLDSIRWQEATFEDWTTLTFRINKPIPLDLSNGSKFQRDINRTFELSGVAGGQRVFHYYADEVNKTLYLQDKNIFNTLPSASKNPKEANAPDDWIPKAALANIGNEINKIDPRAASTRRAREFANAPKNERRNRMVLHYDTKDGTRVIFSGINENMDSIYVVLDRTDRKYTLSKSNLQAGKY